MIVRIDYTPRPFLIVGMKEKGENLRVVGSSDRLSDTPIIAFDVPDKTGVLKTVARTIKLPPGEYSSPFLLSEAIHYIDVLPEMLDSEVHNVECTLGIFNDKTAFFDLTFYKDYVTNDFAHGSWRDSINSILEREKMYLRKNPRTKWKEAQERVFSDFAIVPLKY